MESEPDRRTGIAWKAVGARKRLRFESSALLLDCELGRIPGVVSKTDGT